MSMVHLHLLLNHVPVIGTIIGLFLLAWAVFRREQGLARATLGLFAILAVVALATFLTGEPAEEAVEGLAGVSKGSIERHEEAALLATVALGVLGAASLGVLVRFRRRALPRRVLALLLVLALVPAGAMAWTANLGGQIRHSELRGRIGCPDAHAQPRDVGPLAHLADRDDPHLAARREPGDHRRGIRIIREGDRGHRPRDVPQALRDLSPMRLVHAHHQPTRIGDTCSRAVSLAPDGAARMIGVDQVLGDFPVALLQRV